MKSKITYLSLFTVFLIFIFPSFFYKLGDSSLNSFDEAWYAAIARNISLTHDPFNLYFNGSRFADHPPAGFWLINLTQSVFGSNEFGARAAAAILGLACLGLIFILGTQIASPAIGLASAIALSSSPWFLYRARSGNLDITLTFFFLLSFILAIKSSQNKKFLPILGLTLSFLFLTKTLVPFIIIPSLLVIFWGSGITLSEIIITKIIFLIPFGTWLISQLINYPGFISKYFIIGLPPSQATSVKDNIVLTKTYLHEGIGAFFRPIVLLFPFSIFYKLKSIILFVLLFLTPFAFSSRGQIWHLIPVFPFLILIFFTVIFSLSSKCISKSFLSALIIIISLLIAFPQISKNWRDFVDIPAFVSDQAILSRKSSDYPEDLYIDDRFLPVAVYYSGKIVNDLPTPNILDFFNKSNPILLITHSWRLDQIPQLKNRYELIASDRDLVLIKINNL